jgi:ribulose-phosphate 3-epimerase
MHDRIIISPSILNTDFLHLEDTVKLVNKSEADWIHMDIMDGVFVPNMSFAFPVMEAVKKVSEKPLDTHLMIVNPEKYVEKFAATGATGITVHYEACVHLHSVVQLIKAQGCRPGVAINPHTDAHLLKPILGDIELALIMTVNPGFGGQAFIEHSLKKIEELRELSFHYNPDLIIQVDGGITDELVPEVLRAGADCIVAGTHVFKSPDPVKMINSMKKHKG